MTKQAYPASAAADRLRPVLTAILAILLAGALSAHAAHEHAFFDSVPLDGTWEMAYRPDAWNSTEIPVFAGVPIPNAVPNYWEDMTNAFRSVGMRDKFRINPDHAEQFLPMTGWAKDTTLPNISGCFLYRRKISLSECGAAVLAFEGVRNQVHAWINGKFIAFRQGFSTPFELPVPDGVLRKGENEIVLAVSNTPNTGYNGKPVSGLSTRALFGSTGGVNGRLELRFPRNAISDVHVTTAKDLRSFTVHVSADEPFGWEVRDSGRTIRKGSSAGDFTCCAAGMEFWSPENPKLYELLISASGRSRTFRFGLRRLTAKGEKLELNGKCVYLRGVTEHCYFADTVHMPRDLEYYRRITAKRKELGFNFVRFHTFVPPKEYFEATDELGMMVHVETPNFVTLDEAKAIIAFARRHPSVVIYCTGNETRIDDAAEAYLADFADLVHSETDALFSPMSALRSMEYLLISGKDDIALEPFPHNPTRFANLSKFSDIFTSYQLGMASYRSLDKGSPETIDAHGDAYCGKPRLSHETCIDGSYADLSLEKDYPENSPVLATGIFREIRATLTKRGIIGRADVYFRNSCEWMRRIRKHCFEKLRLADRVAGFDFLGDINSHWHTFGYSVGMMDEFYRLKPGETVENVLRYNSPSVILCNLGRNFNVRAGESKPVRFSISNYSAPVTGTSLHVKLVDAKAGTVRWERKFETGNVPCGKVSSLIDVQLEVPQSGLPCKYLLKADFTAGEASAKNEWELYAFPPPAETSAGADVTVVSDITKDRLLSCLAEGRRVLLLGAGPFNSLPMTYRIGMAGRCSGNFATVIKENHPALEGLPHDGYCGWQFCRLFENAAAVQLEGGAPFDPVIDIASAVKFPIRQSALFEYRVGAGSLLVCSFAFHDDDPAAAWLRSHLIRYASSDRFAPTVQITAGQLTNIIEAPKLCAEENTNFARNANDPASIITE